MNTLPYFISVACLKANRLKALMLWKVIRDRKDGMFNINDKEFIHSIVKEIPNVRRVLKQMLEMKMLRVHSKGWYTIVGSQRFVKDVTGRKTDYYYTVLSDEEVFNLSHLRTRIYACVTELVAHRKGRPYTEKEKIEYFEKVQLNMGSLPASYRISYGKKGGKIKSLFNPVFTYTDLMQVGVLSDYHKRSDELAKRNKKSSRLPKNTNTRTSGRVTDCSLSYLINFTDHGTIATWSRQRKRASELNYIDCVRDYEVVKTFKTLKEREQYFIEHMCMLHDAGLIDQMNRTRRHCAFGKFAVVEDKSSLVWTMKDRPFSKKQYKSNPVRSRLVA